MICRMVTGRSVSLAVLWAEELDQGTGKISLRSLSYYLLLLPLTTHA